MKRYSSRFVLFVAAIVVAGIQLGTMGSPVIVCAAQSGADENSKHGSKEVLYAALGADVTWYDLDVKTGSLLKQNTVTLPGKVQQAWITQTKKFLYVAWSNRVGHTFGGDHHGVTAFRVDPATGALQEVGEPLALASRPWFVTTDFPGTHLLVAYPDPSGLTVNLINADGTIGARVKQPAQLDFGFYAHEVRVEPSNKSVILVARGNAGSTDKPEDAGALKVFDYDDGVLKNRQSVAWNGGLQYRVRSLDFDPSQRWVFVSLEEQQKLHVYKRMPDGTLSSEPLFIKETLADPKNIRPRQLLGAVHVHPNGRFLYVANRADAMTDKNEVGIFEGGENNIAVFRIDQKSGEPTLIQNADTHGLYPHTFALDPTGQILVAANATTHPARQGDTLTVIPASLAIFRVGGDGKLDFLRKYDVKADVDKHLLWVGIVALPR